MCNTRGPKYGAVPKIKKTTNSHVISCVRGNNLYMFSLMNNFIISHISWELLSLFEASTGLRKVVPFWQDTQEFFEALFIISVHPSPMVVDFDYVCDEQYSTGIRLTSSFFFYQQIEYGHTLTNLCHSSSVANWVVCEQKCVNFQLHSSNL